LFGDVEDQMDASPGGGGVPVINSRSVRATGRQRATDAC
jgi:hypothetical protein